MTYRVLIAADQEIVRTGLALIPVAYACAYLAGLRARQAELRGQMTPALVM